MIVHKLIIADGDVPLVENLAAYFRSRGLDVRTAYDALNVLKLVHRDAPDALCLGVGLQCDNGINVCELLSGERSFAPLPCVLLTDHADDWLAHDCRDLQAYYAVKGPELARRVEMLLDEARLREPLVAVD